jgi:hypothetical protein
MGLSIECSIGGTGGKYLRQLGLKPTLNASVAESGWKLDQLIPAPPRVHTTV